MLMGVSIPGHVIMPCTVSHSSPTTRIGEAAIMVPGFFGYSHGSNRHILHFLEFFLEILNERYAAIDLFQDIERFAGDDADAIHLG